MASSSSTEAASSAPFVHRNFYDAYEAEQMPSAAPAASSGAPAVPAADGAAGDSAASSKSALLRYIDSHIVGKHTCLSSPWGWRRIVYADWTASGKPLAFLEDYLRAEVMPTYANTHTSSTVTGLQSSLFRREARDIVKRCLRGSKDDALLFCGSGATGALKTLVHVLALPARARAHAAAGHTGPALVVLLGPYEHHSNILPWREAGAHIVWVRECAQGGVDMADLEAKSAELTRAHPHAMRVGAFSAASNVSGILTDTDAVTRALHRAGFLAFWDYASAAPYVEIDANPGGNDASVAKDAVFLSPHKLVGGPSTPGVLLLKKSLCLNRVPATPGGGTVFFVTEDAHRYLENFEEREEGGTQDIVASVRAGLVFQLKEQVGIRTIAAREESMARMAMQRLSSQSNIVLMGHPSVPRLPIFSFLVRFDAPTGRPLFLHPVFVSTLLNDLFGIQTRAGCLCAGPYGQRVLGISAASAREFEQALVEKHELLRPGFTRFNLSWFVSDAEVEYVLAAVEFVAQHGRLFLPLYNFTADSGEWKHRARARKSLVGRRWIGTVDYSQSVMDYAGTGVTRPERHEDASPDAFERYLKEARTLAAELARPSAHSANVTVDESSLLPAEVRHLRWFVMPSEAADWIRDPATCTSRWKAEASAASTAAAALPVKPLRYVMEGSVSEAAEDTRSLTEAAPSAATGDAAGPVTPASAFALLAPTTSSQPEVTSAAVAPKQAKAEKAHAGQKRAGESAQQQQQSKQSKKQRKADAAAAAASTGADADGDAAMAPAEGQSAAPRNNAPAGDIDLRDDVCKNCWHVHWNAKADAKPASAASGAADAPAGAADARQDAQQYTKECTHCECIHFAPRARRSPKEVAKTAAKIQRSVGMAVRDFDMIRDGDRVLLGISGGKDSLTLFHILRALQKKAPIKFDLACVTVDPQTPEYDPSPLKKYFAALGVPYFYESQPILAAAKASMDGKKQSICSFCARMKRGILYTCMRREGYNVLALGQHLDDLAESLLMSVFHNGMLRTMKANYHAEAGDIRIIRPLIYVRERLTREYANVADLPVINENCPACFEAPKERARVKLLLASQEHVHASLFQNMLQAMRPLMGMENTRLATAAGEGAGAAASAAGDDDEEGTTKAAHDAQLLRALQGVGNGKSAGAAMNEDDADYAALDAICRGPGGACAVPPRKGKKEPAAAAAAAAASKTTEESKAQS